MLTWLIMMGLGFFLGVYCFYKPLRTLVNGGLKSVYGFATRIQFRDSGKSYIDSKEDNDKREML